MNLPIGRAAAFAGLSAALVLGACSDSDDAPTAGSTSTTAAVSETADQSTTTETTETAEPSTPTAFTTEARDAVNELKDAWEAGDQARARAIAPGEVVDALFPIDSSGFQIYGCDLGQFETSTCNFRNRGTGMFIIVSAQQFPEGWQISTITVS